MMKDLIMLAEKVHDLEASGFQISSAWYELEPADRRELERLTGIVTESLNYLQKLAAELNRRLREVRLQMAERDQLQYAYNLTQELIQSRSAVLEILHTVDDDAKLEYLRALAIKERAAETQAKTLAQTLATAH